MIIIVRVLYEQHFSGVNLGSQMHVRIFLIYYIYTQLSKMIPLTNNSDNVPNIATDREELTSGFITGRQKAVGYMI